MNYLILITAILIISLEAILEGFTRRNYPAVSDILFNWWMQVLIAVGLFVVWLLLAVKLDSYYPVIKLVVGFILLRYALFDVLFNVCAGLSINYVGKTKLYDKILLWVRDKWGMSTIWFTKAIALFWGWAWLSGYKQ